MGGPRGRHELSNPSNPGRARNLWIPCMCRLMVSLCHACDGDTTSHAWPARHTTSWYSSGTPDTRPLPPRAFPAGAFGSLSIARGIRAAPGSAKSATIENPSPFFTVPCLDEPAPWPQERALGPELLEQSGAPAERHQQSPESDQGENPRSLTCHRQGSAPATALHCAAAQQDPDARLSQQPRQ